MSTSTSWLGKLKKILARSVVRTTSAVEVHCDVGFGNSLYIRGDGASLSWEKGQPMKNITADIWLWETDAQFEVCSFKVLINDVQYEEGEDHILKHGANILYIPRF